MGCDGRTWRNVSMLIHCMTKNHDIAKDLKMCLNRLHFLMVNIPVRGLLFCLVSY